MNERFSETCKELKKKAWTFLTWANDWELQLPQLGFIIKNQDVTQLREFEISVKPARIKSERKIQAFRGLIDRNLHLSSLSIFIWDANHLYEALVASPLPLSYLSLVGSRNLYSEQMQTAFTSSCTKLKFLLLLPKQKGNNIMTRKAKRLIASACPLLETLTIYTNKWTEFRAHEKLRRLYVTADRTPAMLNLTNAGHREATLKYLLETTPRNVGPNVAIWTKKETCTGGPWVTLLTQALAEFDFKFLRRLVEEQNADLDMPVSIQYNWTLGPRYFWEELNDRRPLILEQFTGLIDLDSAKVLTQVPSRRGKFSLPFVNSHLAVILGRTWDPKPFIEWMGTPKAMQLLAELREGGFENPKGRHIGVTTMLCTGSQAVQLDLFQHPRLFNLSIDRPCRNGCTALHYCPSLPRLKELLKHKPSIYTIDKHGRNALECLAYRRSAAAVSKLLLDLPNADFEKLCTPSVFAVSMLNTEAIFDRFATLIPQERWQEFVTPWVQSRCRCVVYTNHTIIKWISNPPQRIASYVEEGLMTEYTVEERREWQRKVKVPVERRNFALPLALVILNYHFNTGLVVKLLEIVKSRHGYNTPEWHAWWARQVDDKGRNFLYYSSFVTQSTREYIAGVNASND